MALASFELKKKNGKAMQPCRRFQIVQRLFKPGERSLRSAL